MRMESSGGGSPGNAAADAASRQALQQASETAREDARAATRPVSASVPDDAAVTGMKTLNRMAFDLKDRGAELIQADATAPATNPATVAAAPPPDPAAPTSIAGLGTMPSYTGDLPSPLQATWYAPEADEVFKTFIPDSEIRGWVKDAAAYNDVPQELMATVLQQENAPTASPLRQFLQFGERSLTTFSAIVDQLPFSPVPDALAGGSSGIANMKRATLQAGASYIESTYGRPPLPDSVRYRALGWDQDTRIPGDDLKSDLYYASGVMRQLIDREMGAGYHGPLSLAQTERIIASYNGSGPMAQKYGHDAINAMQTAAAGGTPLYFYER
jgi:hypothetical protein